MLRRALALGLWLGAGCPAPEAPRAQPPQSAVLFSADVPGWLRPLACYDAGASAWRRHDECLALLPARASVQLATGQHVTGAPPARGIFCPEAALEEGLADPSLFEEAALPVPTTEASLYAVWPSSAGRRVTPQANASAEWAALSPREQERLTEAARQHAPGASAEVELYQRIPVRLEGGTEPGLVYVLRVSPTSPALTPEESYRWETSAGMLWYAPPRDAVALQLLGQASSYTVEAVSDLDANGREELLITTNLYEGSQRALFRWEADRWVGLGEARCLP